MPNAEHAAHGRAMNQIHIQVAVIGAGTAGLAAYRAARAAGKRALLIEGGPGRYDMRPGWLHAVQAVAGCSGVRA